LMAPRLLLDGMLGSLARWLRIGGYDTEYRKDTDDDVLIEEALADDRILLTRDEVLVNRARKRGVEAIFVEKGDEKALSQLTKKLGITFDPTQARCPKCNHTVEKVAKEKVVDRVPDGTYKVVDDYWVCPRCGGVYWRGSHWPRIVETLSNAVKSA
jgi:uncharacterized protein